ncbi:excalibur calcium-binding domain-containing protein [Okeania sp. SIO2B3]|uniref:excalibur calcium-binding domain-containing protein n=1 Tax=Okeania sp. SIO2B3 TaxID=2607784 RepID=UPI0013C04D9F|nr:excalibur calcium-binding domain-containing protein [Okeania sp. SIO2B3]NET46997.1 excalibur calcium-binding domain-containing protein [Okeania sp. SIO2B3]
MIDFFLLLAQSPSPECLPQYPTTVSGKEICIFPPPPALGCADIKKEYGESIIVVEVEGRESDPQRLDRDKDGVGCE